MSGALFRRGKHGLNGEICEEETGGMSMRMENNDNIVSYVVALYQVRDCFEDIDAVIHSLYK